MRRHYIWAPKRYGVAAGNFTVVDWLHRMNTAALDAATPTVGELDGGTFGLATGTWSKTGTDGFWTQESDNSPSIPGLGLSGGSGFGATTRNAGYPMSVNPGITFRGATFTWGTAKATISVGFAIRVDTDIAGTDTGDLYHSVRLDGGAGNFFIAGHEIEGVNLFKMGAHCNNANGAYVTGLSRGSWYWVTMLWTNSATCDLKVHGPLPALTLIGSSQGTKLDGTSSCTGIRCFGRTDNTGQVTINANIHRSTCHCARFANVHPLLPVI